MKDSSTLNTYRDLLKKICRRIDEVLLCGWEIIDGSLVHFSKAHPKLFRYLRKHLILLLGQQSGFRFLINCQKERSASYWTYPIGFGKRQTNHCNINTRMESTFRYYLFLDAAPLSDDQRKIVQDAGLKIVKEFIAVTNEPMVIIESYGIEPKTIEGLEELGNFIVHAVAWEGDQNSTTERLLSTVERILFLKTSEPVPDILAPFLRPSDSLTSDPFSLAVDNDLGEFEAQDFINENKMMSLGGHM